MQVVENVDGGKRRLWKTEVVKTLDVMTSADYNMRDMYDTYDIHDMLDMQDIQDMRNMPYIRTYE